MCPACGWEGLVLYPDALPPWAKERLAGAARQMLLPGGSVFPVNDEPLCGLLDAYLTVHRDQTGEKCLMGSFWLRLAEKGSVYCRVG
jgi:hypothetical protein